jgi:hypothetical protein
MHKITQLCDMEAPVEEIFNTVVNIDKRMQLSPLWGLSRLAEVSADYPSPGSRYRIRVLPGAPFGLSNGTLNASQSALRGLAEFLMMKFGQMNNQSPSDEAQPPESSGKQESTPVEHDYIVVEHHPVDKFTYQLDDDCKTIITWSFKSIPSGTRVIYEECFYDDTVCNENYIATVHQVVKEWLTNIRRYCELRGSRGRILIKWFLDRFYLRLRPDQRRMVLLMLVMQAVWLATFLIVVLVWGLPRLLF